MMEIASKLNPQFSLNGPKSVWILKPAGSIFFSILKKYETINFKGLSRGRGIRCYDDIVSLLDAIIAKDLRWVAQKYIENPLIVKSRKVFIFFK